MSTRSKRKQLYSVAKVEESDYVNDVITNDSHLRHPDCSTLKKGDKEYVHADNENSNIYETIEDEIIYCVGMEVFQEDKPKVNNTTLKSVRGRKKKPINEKVKLDVKSSCVIKNKITSHDRNENCGEEKLITKSRARRLNIRQCPECGEFVRQKLYSRHMASHTRRFICDMCPKEFYFKCELERHKNVHTREKEYPCKYCQRVFRAPSSMNSHIVNVHKNERQFICTACGKRFNENYRLVDHYRHIHEGIRPEICSVCGKTARDKTNLRYHMRVHTKAKSLVQTVG